MTTKNIGIKQSLSHTIEFSKNTHPPTPPATQPANFSEHKLSFGICHPLRGNSTSLANPIPGRKPGHPDPAGRTCSAHPEPRCTSLHTAEKHQGDRREPRTRFRKPLTWTFVPVRLPGAAPCRSDSKKVTRSCRPVQIARSLQVSYYIHAGRAVAIDGASGTDPEIRPNCLDVICVIPRNSGTLGTVGQCLFGQYPRVRTRPTLDR